MLRLALNKNKFLGLLGLMLSVVLAGCGVEESAGVGGAGSGTTVSLAASSTALVITGTSTITATVLDNGSNAANGTSVTFTMDNAFGTIATSPATTTSGIATVTFTATAAGTVIITATSGTANDTVTITIAGASTAPASVGLAASATALPVGTTSTITATVLDSSSTNVPDGTSVAFTLSDNTLGTITTSANTTSGIATATFTASNLEGTVTITATAGSVAGNVAITVSGTNSITVTANPTSLTSSGTSSVSAALLDINAANMPDGTTVTWTLNPDTLGTITSPTTTVGGTASTTFVASSSNIGLVTVTAASYSVNNTTTITVNAPATGSIAFTSSTPDTIGLVSSGKTTTSTVQFTVRDTSGNLVLDGINVDFCLNGPSGIPNPAGSTPSSSVEYINEKETVEESWTDSNGNGCFDTGETYVDANTNTVYDSPFHASVSTVSGLATVYLNSGSVSGNATIFATVVSTGISTSSPTISIGGGLPTMDAFTVAASTLNLPGLAYIGRTSTISVYLADRVGNANVLEGTTVSYYTESGATLTSSSTLDATGFTSVTFRTQNPDPENVAEEAWETTLLTDLNTRYGVSLTANTPRDGWASIMVAVVGEESFVDANANNTYDTGETFTDTLHEPFTDINDDGAWTDGTGADPREIFVDNDGDGTYDGLNAQWDASKTLFRNITLAITGGPTYMLVSSSEPFTDVGNGTWDTGETFTDAYNGTWDIGETYTDDNPANGAYDLGETFIDALNGVYDVGETYVDEGDGVYDMGEAFTDINGNTTWDSSGVPFTSPFVVADKGSQTFTVLVADQNLNYLTSGTTVTVTLSGGGAMTGTSSYTFPDAVTSAPFEMSFTLSDSTTSDTDSAEITSIEIKVTWEGTIYTSTISGTVD